jgi:hypothetical protein
MQWGYSSSSGILSFAAIRGALGKPPPDPETMKRANKALTIMLLLWLGTAALQRWYRLAQESRREGKPPGEEEQSLVAILEATEAALESVLQTQAPGAAPGTSIPPDLTLTPLAPGAALAAAPLPAPPPPGTQFAVTVKRGIYLRPEAKRDSGHRASLSAGIYVKATGNQKMDADGNLWYEVTSGRHTGWVLAKTPHGHDGWVAPQPYGVQSGNGGRDNPALARDDALYAVRVRTGDTFARLARGREDLAEAVKRNNQINDPERLRKDDVLYFKKKDAQPQQ